MPREDVRIAAALTPRQRLESIADDFIRYTQRSYDIAEMDFGVLEVRFHGKTRRLHMAARFSIIGLLGPQDNERIVRHLESAWRTVLEDNA